jgi:hypothetical protein
VRQRPPPSVRQRQLQQDSPICGDVTAIGVIGYTTKVNGGVSQRARESVDEQSPAGAQRPRDRALQTGRSAPSGLPPCPAPKEAPPYLAPPKLAFAPLRHSAKRVLVLFCEGRAEFRPRLVKKRWRRPAILCSGRHGGLIHLQWGGFHFSRQGAQPQAFYLAPRTRLVYTQARDLEILSKGRPGHRTRVYG